MSWPEYKAIQTRDTAQLTKELAPLAKDGWRPILLSATQEFIVVILEHLPGSGQQFQAK
jgi:hypothetical protein